MSKRDAPATHRNREPILEVLARRLDKPARVLEVASGTGQHAVFFAEQMPHLVWQPTDQDASSLGSIASWVAESGLGNARPPIELDAALAEWPFERGAFDALFNANMIHISPWDVGLGLLAGAGRLLRRGGQLFLYGPFKQAGAQTAPSNEAFDEDLRRRNPDWGIRNLEGVIHAAKEQRLSHVETNQLPANNLLIVFERDPD